MSGVGDLRSVLVVGAGLVGSSVGLALRRHGVDVRLRDRDPDVARLAARLGAGRVEDDEGRTEPSDLAVLAVPPGQVGRVLVEAQAAGLARAYTDVASVKTQVSHEAERLGADLSSYVGGHPLAGREVSGPEGARSDLFEGRPWVLTHGPGAAAPPLAAARALVELCGAVPVVMDEREHDDAVALVSHVPHVLASLAAGQLAEADPAHVRLAGQGVRDVTRIAASDPKLWRGILRGNAGPVAALLRAVRGELDAVVAALEALAPAGDAGAAEDVLLDILRRGAAGRARLPEKPLSAATAFAAVPVVVADRPGALVRLLADVAAEDVNVEDLTIEHSPAQPVGWVRVHVLPDRAESLAAALRERGWPVHGAGWP